MIRIWYDVDVMKPHLMQHIFNLLAERGVIVHGCGYSKEEKK
jgi:hypothetical protein